LSIDTCTYVDYRKNAVLDRVKMEISGPAYAKSTSVLITTYIFVAMNKSIRLPFHYAPSAKITVDRA